MLPPCTACHIISTHVGPWTRQDKVDLAIAVQHDERNLKLYMVMTIILGTMFATAGVIGIFVLMLRGG